MPGSVSRSRPSPRHRAFHVPPRGVVVPCRPSPDAAGVARGGECTVVGTVPAAIFAPREGRHGPTTDPDRTTPHDPSTAHHRRGRVHRLSPVRRTARRRVPPPRPGQPVPPGPRPRPTPARLPVWRRRAGRRRRPRPGGRRPGPGRVLGRLPPGRGRRRRPEHVPDRRLHQPEQPGHGRVAGGRRGPPRARHPPGRRQQHERLRRGPLPGRRRHRGRPGRADRRPAPQPPVGGPRARRQPPGPPAHARDQAHVPGQRLRPVQVRPGADVPHGRPGLRHRHGPPCGSSTSSAPARRCPTRTPACWPSSPAG